MEGILSTYRVQLNRGFRLADLRALVPQLAMLGVSHVYLSPILRARAGSGHGYDVVDPITLNPEIGTESELQELVATLRSHKMGLVLDIVPNHMATGRENHYWEDVLTHGRTSPFADWFDIDWGPNDAERPHRVFLPVLGDRLARVIARHEIKLAHGDDGFRFSYYEESFPVDPATLPVVLEAALAECGGTLGGSERLALAEINARLGSLPSRSAGQSDPGARRRQRALEALEELEALYGASAGVRSCIDSALEVLNRVGGEKRLRKLLAAQAYRLAYWRRGAREINYRRFFTISHLVGLRTEDPRVFDQTHVRVLDWIRRGWVDAIRLDHIDGLLDPAAYLNRLRGAVGESAADQGREDIPIYVEKVLARDERLPHDWPVAGTTGYDFLNEVEDILIDPNGYWDVDAAYGRFIRRTRRFADIARQAKRRILAGHLAAECRRLALQLERLAGAAADLPRASLVTAITETVACLTVYRTYLDGRSPTPRSSDVRALTRAIKLAGSIGRATDPALELLKRYLLPQTSEPPHDAGAKARLEFAQRFQQLCVSAAAKGVEDTALYVHVPLVSRNEVGADPGEPFPAAREALHAANLHRALDWPTGLLCTSTHDTKRSADVRARLDVISELPDLWESRLRRWHRFNRAHRTRLQGRYAPDRNTEYLFYETLIGLWPVRAQLEGSSPESEELRRIEARVAAYMQKAAREAKAQTSWVEPNQKFEVALKDFVRAALSPDRSRRFLSDVDGFVRRIDHSGRWNSLARTLIHLTAPGVPDIYQGDEIWNFSLVDPDNRRPVDYGLRKEKLERITAWERAPAEERRAFLSSLAENPADDRAKLWVTHRALRARRAHPDLFVRGGYEPLGSTGPRSGHLFVFARSHLDRSAVTAVATRTASLASDASAPPIGRIWAATELQLPSRGGPAGWRCALSGAFVSLPPGAGRRVPATLLLESLPMALLLPEALPAGATPWGEPA